MFRSEASFRIRSVHKLSRPRAGGAALCYQAAYRRTPQKNCAESLQAWAEVQAKGQETFRLGPRFSAFVDFLFLAYLAGDFSKGQTLANDSRCESVEAVTVIHILTIIEPERLLIDVAEQMEGFDADVGAVQLPLNERPKVFHPVSVNVSISVFDRVIDDPMSEAILQTIVGLQFIGEDCSPRFDMLVNVLLEFLLSAIVHNHRTDVSAAFQHAHHDSLVLAAGAGNFPRASGLVHIARLATHEGLVNLNFVAELSASEIVLHGQPEALKHEPCGLLRYSQRSVKFPRANAVLAICDHPHGHKPLVQANRRILKDRSDLDGKLRLRMASLALPQPARLQEGNILGATRRTDRAVLPFRPSRHQEVKAVVRIGVEDDRFLKCLWFGCHDESSITGIA